MFKIEKIIMSHDNETFEYKFNDTITYFVGSNNTGKTEFYKFIDYMLGSSIEIKNHKWYKNHLDYAVLCFTYNNISYKAKRYIKNDTCSIFYDDEEEVSVYSLDEYKSNMKKIFSAKEEVKSFLGIDLSYRAFTLFNFLGEKRLGNMNDFFDKCTDKNLKYLTNDIINYIFNNKITEIIKLKDEIKKLEDEIKRLDIKRNKNELLVNNININLNKLGIKNKFSMTSKEKVLKVIEKYKRNLISDDKDNKSLATLENIYNNINEKIKIENKNYDENLKMKNEADKRKKLVNTLNSIASDNPNLAYLTDTIKNIENQLDESISFSNKLVNKDVLKSLKKQRDQVLNDIKRIDNSFKVLELEDKKKTVTLIEEFIRISEVVDYAKLDLLQKDLKDLKERLKRFETENDEDKIKDLSQKITYLYTSAKNVSEFVRIDTNTNGFEIIYNKKGNLLQTVIAEEDNLEKVNYIVGSMARHSLIQLSGYLGFMNMLLKEKKYPIVPILVFDHISKPYDYKSSKAIGVVLDRFYNLLSESNIDCQVFMFEDVEPQELNIDDKYKQYLYNDKKSGFNPFYYEVN